MTKWVTQKSFAAGIIANAGTLGILIPPSIVMVVYAASCWRVCWPVMSWRGLFLGWWLAVCWCWRSTWLLRIKKLPAEEWKVWSFNSCGKEAGWGLFLCRYHHGWLFMVVCSQPTEAGCCCSRYSMFHALFVFTVDMGHLWKGKHGTNDEDAPHARVGFNGNRLWRVVSS